MTKEEYLEQKRDIQHEFEKELYKLAVKFVESNNKVKLGDIVADDLTKIKVTRHTIRLTSDFPIVSFYGIPLDSNYIPTGVTELMVREYNITFHLPLGE